MFNGKAIYNPSGRVGEYLTSLSELCWTRTSDPYPVKVML